jgi:hypothetical protein
MEEAIFAELTADPTLAAKLTAGGSRYHLYPLRVPEGVHIAQAVTFTEITQSLTYPLLRTSVFQFTCIGNTFDKARNLADDIDRIFTIQGAYQLGNVSVNGFLDTRGPKIMRH